MLDEALLVGREPVGRLGANRARASGEHILGAEKVGDVRRRRFAEHLLRIALLHDASAVEHDRDVAEQTGFGEIVRHLEHREPSLEVDRAQNAPRDVARSRIERAERLVEQQHLRPARQRARDRDELSFTAAQRRRPTDRASASTPKRAATSSAVVLLAAPYSTFWWTVRCGNRYAC